MSEKPMSNDFSRRTVLIGAAGAVPLLALGATGARAAKLSQSAVRYQDSPKDGKQLRRLQPLHRAERVQERRRDDFAVKAGARCGLRRPDDVPARDQPREINCETGLAKNRMAGIEKMRFVCAACPPGGRRGT